MNKLNISVGINEIEGNKIKKDEHSFIVALIPTIPFPTDEPLIDDCHYYAVISANNDGGEWGFCDLTADEKHTIGDEMIRLNCESNTWYCCNMTKTRN